MSTRPSVTLIFSAMEHIMIINGAKFERVQRGRETYSRIQHATINPIERPDIHSNRNSKSSSNKEQRRRVRNRRVSACSIFQCGDSNLCWGESREEEEEGSEELAGHGDEVVTDCVARAGCPVP